MSKKLSIIKTITSLIAVGFAIWRVYKYLETHGVVADLKRKAAKYTEEKNSLFNQQERPVGISALIPASKPVALNYIKPKLKAIKVKKNLPVIKKVNTIVKSAAINYREISPRTKLVKEFVRTRKFATMGEITNKFSSVTSRTLRRDLDQLERAGFVIQEGKTKGTGYRWIK